MVVPHLNALMSQLLPAAPLAPPLGALSAGADVRLAAAWQPLQGGALGVHKGVAGFLLSL